MVPIATGGPNRSLVVDKTISKDLSAHRQRPGLLRTLLCGTACDRGYSYLDAIEHILADSGLDEDANGSPRYYDTLNEGE